VVRRSFHDDTWIASLENRLRATTDDVVISDCRFPNEIGAIKRAGGIVVRVHRGADPPWYALAETVNRVSEHNAEWSCAKTQLETYGIHASETAWVGTKFDSVLDNNATVDDLFAKINDLLAGLQVSKAQPVA
jgi:hypothetical protein